MSSYRVPNVLVLCLLLAGCQPTGGGGGAVSPAGGSARRSASQAGPQLIVPRAWMEAQAALTLLGRRADVRYAVTVPRLEGLVGPLPLGAKTGSAELLAAVARATGTEITRRGGVLVLQPAGSGRHLAPLAAEIKSGDADRCRAAIFDLGESFRLEALPTLIGLLESQDATIRRSALLALGGFEGDFAHNEWPGRVSVFELPGVKLSTDTMMWVVEEASAPGGAEWLAAVSILGRARESQLPRSIWWKPWNKTQGTIMPSIWAMGRCGDPAVRSTLDKRVRKTFTNRFADRLTTAEAVARLGLTGTLKKHASPKYPVLVRCAAAHGLGLCGESPSVFQTLKKLLADKDSRVREVAVLSLIELDTPESIGLLSKILLDNKADVRLRCAAAGVIARFSLDELQVIEGDRLIAAALKEKDPRVRAAVAEALGELGGPGSAERLAGLLKDRDRWVRAAAGRALASIGGAVIPGEPVLAAKAGPYVGLGKQLTNTKADVEVRTAIAIGMGQSRSPLFAGPLSEVALNPDEDWRLRKYAARSLATLAERAGQPALKKLLEMKSGGITDIPLRYLDLGGAAETTKYLAPYVTTGEGRHQQSCAAERIGELGTPEGVDLLCAAFNAFDNYTRCTQVYSLQFNGNVRVRRRLEELLKGSRRRGVRMNAALALSGTGDPRAVDALVAALRDETASVRMAAVNSLGNCGDPAAAGELVRVMSEDENTKVVHQALRALRMRGYAELKQVREAMERVRGTDRDCGVPGGPSVWEQPANSWVLRKYYRTYDDLTLPNLTYESTACYDQATGRIVQWGAHGRRADSPQTGLTWVLDTRSATWSRPATRERPPGTCCNRDMAADPKRGLIISTKSGGVGGHGWLGRLRGLASRSVPWAFDVKKGQWYPMRPVRDPGSHGMVATCYDRRNDAIVVHGGRERIYDPHANTWTTMRPPEPRPHEKGQQPGAYDPVTGRFIMLADADARGRARTWAYDLAADRWTDLEAENPPPAMREPMVYDSVNDVMLVFRPAGGRYEIYVYHLRENRWEQLPAVHPSPSYHMSDAVYDPVHNVTWLIGGWEWGSSAAVTTRETWTFRYRKPQKPRRSAEPRGLKLEIKGVDGKPAPSLSWRPPEAGAPGGYNVYRGEGPKPWEAAWKKVNAAPVKDTGLTDATRLDTAKRYYYRVTALDGDGKEGPPSLLARVSPAVVRRTMAAQGEDGTLTLSWEPSAGPDVVAYNVYGADGGKADLWARPFVYRDLEGKFSKVNAKPIHGTSFTQRPESRPPHLAARESTWPHFGVYVVRAVNSLGFESGNGPATLSIPAAPGPVVVFRTGDGRRLVISGEGGSEVRGHHLMRLDVYKGDLTFRMRGAPQPGTVFVDEEAWPVGHRRQYFVVGVDGAGQLGVPSSAGWQELP